MKITNIATALSLFEEAAAKHGEATETGDYRTGNKCWGVIDQAIKFIKEQNETSALSRFLDHRAVGVRLWAASYMLPINENEAIKVLEHISGQSGLNSLSARTTLSEWRKGSLKL